eukprot:TRINITY_DN188_c0_g1_i2.p1 TRINITY_DN188_c0_g1~~TRINITY_DN188_c0_g1_i2.p1  ORF type:complete len:290 (-),score=63.61 TRINITY_DN188_c0_g1_i2:63-932(-)
MCIRDRVSTQSTGNSMLCHFLITFAILICVPLTQAYHTGAGACTNPGSCMTPVSDNGMTLTFGDGVNLQYAPGESYPVTLKGTTGDIAGWLLYVEDSTGFRVGTWTIMNGTQAKTGCNGGDASSFTHATNVGWGTSQTFTWTAPSSGSNLTLLGVGVRPIRTWMSLRPVQLTPAPPPPPASVSIKVTEEDSYVVGKKYTLKTKVKNTGAGSLSNFMVDFEAQTPLSITAISGASCTSTGNNWSCPVSFLDVDDSITLKPTVMVNGAGKLSIDVGDATTTWKSKSVSIDV